MTDTSAPLLSVRGLRTHFITREGVVRAVDSVDLEVHRGEVLGLVGESGSGKSVTSLSIMGLVPRPGQVLAGDIDFEGYSLLDLSEKRLAALRGDRISMIFQQPTSSLNPVFRVGAQIREVFKLHRGAKKAEGDVMAEEMLRMVGIPDPAGRARSYPHEFSGGMAQRVMIAMALSCEPDLLIADEPTTALDVTIQAQILDLMRDLQRDRKTAVLLITHDLGVVAEMADRVAVMYAGEIVEETDVQTLFADAHHPYTKGLLGSVPVLGQPAHELAVIPGTVPSLMQEVVGCRFADRCTARVEANLDICLTAHPELKAVGEGHKVRCWLYEETP
jgi:oligopeptide/dipeptide ABC transporter ATP-binding protein